MFLNEVIEQVWRDDVHKRTLLQMMERAERLSKAKTNKETGKLAKAFLLFGLGDLKKTNAVINEINKYYMDQKSSESIRFLELKAKVYMLEGKRKDELPVRETIVTLQKEHNIHDFSALQVAFRKQSRCERGIGKYADAIKSLEACRGLLENESEAAGNKNQDLSDVIEIEIEIAEIFEEAGNAEDAVGRYLLAIRMHEKLEKEQFDKRVFEKTANTLLAVMQRRRVLAEVYEIGAEIFKLVQIYFPLDDELYDHFLVAWSKCSLERLRYDAPLTRNVKCSNSIRCDSEKSVEYILRETLKGTEDFRILYNLIPYYDFGNDEKGKKLEERVLRILIQIGSEDLANNVYGVQLFYSKLLEVVKSIYGAQSKENEKLQDEHKQFSLQLYEVCKPYTI